MAHTNGVDFANDLFNIRIQICRYFLSFFTPVVIYRKSLSSPPHLKPHFFSCFSSIFFTIYSKKNGASAPFFRICYNYFVEFFHHRFAFGIFFFPFRNEFPNQFLSFIISAQFSKLFSNLPVCSPCRCAFP